MALIHWQGEENFFSQLDRMQREMERLMSAFGSRVGLEPGSFFRPNVYPPMNIYDDQESYIVRAEVPGADLKNMDISVTGDTLSIKGERAAPQTPEGASYHRREIGYGQFRRALTLPGQVDSSKVTASYTNGILEIRLPRAEQAKLRKIQVKTE